MWGSRAREASRSTGAARRLGLWAEWAALGWLLLKGYRLRDRQWRCGLGELDLVMERRGITVFVEVKARSSSLLGGAAAAVTREKQARMARIAALYLGRHGLWERPCRFDVVLIERRGRGDPGWPKAGPRRLWLRRADLRRLLPGWRLRHEADAFRPELGRQL